MKVRIPRSTSQEARITYHRVIVKTIAPGNFHDNIQLDEIITSVEHPNIALAAANINKLWQKLAAE